MVILTSLIGALVVIGVLQAALSVTLVRHIRSLRHTEARVEHFNDALALLTEATESGFRSTAAELQRMAAVRRNGQRPLEVQNRLERAASLGESVSQMASQEGLSEGEVQLRLHMAHAAADGAPTKESHVGAM